MTGIVNSTGAKSGIIGTTVGTPAGGVAGTEAFGVSGTGGGGVVIADGAILAFNDKTSQEDFDTGNNFDVSTYKYTIDGTGVYLFYFGVYTSASDVSNSFGFSSTNNGRMGIMKDGSLRFTADYMSDSSESFLRTATLIFPFTDGDDVWVIATGISDYWAGSSYFGGCRLS